MSDWTDDLFELSKDDQAIIVGSDVRRLIGEIRRLRGALTGDADVAVTGCGGRCCADPRWEIDCQCCEGSGEWESGEDCLTCGGTGRVKVPRPAAASELAALRAEVERASVALVQEGAAVQRLTRALDEARASLARVTEARDQYEKHALRAGVEVDRLTAECARLREEGAARERLLVEAQTALSAALNPQRRNPIDAALAAAAASRAPSPKEDAPRCEATHADWTGDFEDNIRCPHCGREDHEHTDYPRALQHDGDRASAVCSYCDCDFEVRLCASYTYATEPVGGTGRSPSTAANTATNTEKEK